MITIVDYAMGNLGPILNMLKRIGGRARISALKEDIRNEDKLILSGVGPFDASVRKLQELGLVEVLNEGVLGKRIPILGISLGMQ